MTDKYSLPGGFLMKKRLILIIGLFLLAGLAFTGCSKRSAILLDTGELPKNYSRPLPEGELALRKIIDPTQIPDYTRALADLEGLAEAIDRSLSYLSKPSSRQFYPYGEITHDSAVKTLLALKTLVRSGLPPEQMNLALREKFDTYISVGCDDRGTVLFTGYYTPILDGSPVRTERFRYPLYQSPQDLIKDADGQILGQRISENEVRPYPSRAGLNGSGQLEGREIVWLSDPFEVYIVHVQGSAKIRLPGGQVQTFGYDAHNGWDYQSIVPQMIADGKISTKNINLQALIDYFQAHPDEVDNYVNLNPRFVFFKAQDGRPRGSLNEPVTPFRTIATDKSVYPRAMFAFAAVDLAHPIGFALDQDAGGAIRAPGRCDVYMGEGEKAGELAGGTYREGKLYYLFLKQAVDRSTPTDQSPSFENASPEN